MDEISIPTVPTETREALDQALVALHRAIDLLQVHFSTLTPEARAELGGTPDAFPKTAVATLEALDKAPQVAQACPKFDRAQVESDLALVLALAPLANQIEQLSHLVDDAHHQAAWKAYVGLLPAYQIAKAIARYDTTVQPVVAPLQGMYASFRQTRKGPKNTKS